MSLVEPAVYRDVDPEASLGFGPPPQQPVLQEIQWDALNEKYGKNMAFAQAVQQARYNSERKKWEEYKRKTASGESGGGEGAGLFGDMTPAERKLLAEQPEAWAASEITKREAAYPGIDPDLALDAMLAGVDDPKVWEELWEQSKEATRARVNEQRENEEVPRDWADNVPVIKAASRTAFAALMTPYEMISSLGRTDLPRVLSVEGIIEEGAKALGADVDVPKIPGLTSSAPAMKVDDPNVQGEFRTKPLLDQVWTAMGSNQTAQAVGALMAGDRVEMGDGWVPAVDYEDPDTISGKIAQRNDRMANYVPQEGDYVTKKRDDGTWAVYGPGNDDRNFDISKFRPGGPSQGMVTKGTGQRNIVRVFNTEAEANEYVAAPKPYTPFGDALTVTLGGMKYGTEMQKVASGVADAFALLALDPINFIPAGSMGGKAGRLASKSAGEARGAATTVEQVTTTAEMVKKILNDAAEAQTNAAALRAQAAAKAEALRNPPPPASAADVAATPPRPATDAEVAMTPPLASDLPPEQVARNQAIWDSLKVPTSEQLALEAGSPRPLSPLNAWQQEAAETLTRLGLQSDDAATSRALTYELENVYRFISDAESRAYADIARERAELEGRIAGLSDDWAKDSLNIGLRDADAEAAEAARIAGTADSTGQGNAAWRAGKVDEEADQIRDRALAEDVVAAAKQDELDALKAAPMPVNEAERVAFTARIAELEQEVAEAVSVRMPVTEPTKLFDEQLATLRERLSRLEDPEEVVRRVVDIWDIEGPQRTWLYALLTDAEAPMGATKAATKPEFKVWTQGTGKFATTGGWEITQAGKGKWAAKSPDGNETITFRTKKAAVAHVQKKFDDEWTPVVGPDTPPEVPPRFRTEKVGVADEVKAADEVTPPPAQAAAQVDPAAAATPQLKPPPAPTVSPAQWNAEMRRQALLEKAARLERAAEFALEEARRKVGELIGSNPTAIRQAITGANLEDVVKNMPEGQRAITKGDGAAPALTEDDIIAALTSTPEGMKSLMDDVLGVVRDPNGKVQLDINSFLQAILGKKMDAVFTVLARDVPLGKLSRLFRNSLPQNMIGELHKASSVDDVRSVFVKWIADGQLMRHTEAMRDLRRWSRVIAKGVNKGESVQKAGDAALDLIDKRRLIPRTILWGAQGAGKAVPWSYRVKADDVDGAVKMFQDSMDWIFRGRRQAKRLGFDRKFLDDIEERYLERIINAPGGPERKEAWLDFWNEMALEIFNRAKNKDGSPLLNSKEYEQLQQLFKQHTMKVNDAVRWNAAEYSLLSENGGNSKYVQKAREFAEKNGVTDDIYVDGNVAPYGSLWNEDMWAPNPKKIRRLVRDVKRMKNGKVGENAGTKIADFLFDKGWRTLVLILRPAFTMRNYLDAQVRLYLGGYQNIFSNPLQTLAAFHHAVSEPKSRVFKAMYKLSKPIEHFDKLKYRPDGNPWMDPNNLPADVDMMEFEQGMFQIIDWKQSVMDTLTPDAQMLKQYGRRFAKPDSDASLYWRGVADEMGKMWADPLFRSAANIILNARGSKSGRVPPSLIEYARANLNIPDLANASYRTQQDVLIHAALHGDGEYAETWRKVRAMVKRRDGKNVNDLEDPEYLRRYFFGEDTIYSYRSRLERYTEWDDEVIEALWGGRYDKLSTQMSGTSTSWAVANNANVQQRNDALAEMLKAKFGDTAYTTDNVPSSVAPLWDKAPEAGALSGVHSRFVEGFFNTDLWYQQGWQVPLYKERFWEVVADALPAMSRAEADKVMATAKKSFRGPAMPNSYKGRIRKKLEEGYKKVGPDGSLTLDDAMTTADRVAGQEAFDMFYTASQRNATAYKVRFLIPFAQAWANTLKVWGTLAAEAPLRLHKPIRAYQGATSPGSAVLPAYFNEDSEYEPNRPLIWQDKRSGEMVYEIPLMGPVVSTIANVGSKGMNPLGNSGHLPGVQTTSTLNSLNLLFQGGFFPGVSPFVQVPANAISNSKAWANMPNVLGVKDQILPYRDPDAAPSSNWDAIWASFVPTAVKAATAPFIGGDWSSDTAKYASEAASAIYSTNPAAYTNTDGAINRDKLEADANRYAKWMVFAQGMSTISYPGTVRAKPLTATEQGTLMLQEMLAREYYTEVQALGGDRGLALKQLLDKHGDQAILAVLSSRDGAIRPTTEGWKWFQNNKAEVTDANAQDVLPYFFVKDGTFSKEYNLYLKNYGKNERQSPQEMITQAETLRKAMEIDQLNVQYARGEISEEIWNAAKDQVNIEFSARGVQEMTPAARTEKINSMALALRQSPSLAATPGGQKVSEWLELRDEALLIVRSRELESDTASADPFKAKKAADIRLYLFNEGESMAAESEDFKYAWDSVFKHEVSPK